ncbi:hypothetical protein F5B22DRAFT_659468 [Xylaria bambusicola]|uniref:uncharacterized protein n=1 Tax=Xylaria bambusicola TaxID=326684 RepID=UPI002007E303|nr:uncharacterized protein F5B22DRAFT_659468 [Xylaria bambusicola]KAI0523735.1 hypothetical protein F5B22DRAFT_659468 [Xylaria bambusicola]
MTKIKGGRQRAYRPKTRSGCLTCKVRRVKCDEGRPDCLRCTSTGRTCDGYAHTTAPIAGSGSVLQGPSLEIQASPRSKRSFAFFMQCTCSQLAGFFGSEFWERLVFQAAYNEPAVRHAVVAIGSRHELAIYQKAAERDAVGCFALGEYNLAIRHLINPSQGKAQRSVDVYLIMSILFACFENIQGNHASAITHLQSGVKLLRETVYDRDSGALDCQQFETANRINSYASFQTYAKIFALLDSQASRIIGDYYQSFIQSSPPSYADAVYGAGSLSFSSIDEARTLWEYGACLFSGTLDTKLSDASMQLPHKPVEGQRSHLVNLTSKYFYAVEDLIQSRKSHFTPREELAAAILQLNVLVTWVSFEIELQYPKATWDKFMPKLNDMVLLGEQIVSLISSSNDSKQNTSSFCLESGYILPMYAVASNSRDIGIRRRAIAVLRSVSRQEGLWNSFLAADAAERVIEIEQRVAREMSVCGDGYEELELFSSRPLLEIDAKGGRLHYTRSPHGCQPPHDVVEEVFSW